MKSILLAGIVAFVATTAVAHSPLKATMPANEANIAAAPTELMLDFKGEVRLTKVSMTHAPHDSIELDLSGTKGFISDYILPMEGMGNGVYVIDWRGLGKDGHPMKGSKRAIPRLHATS
ncbi:copper resistance CopC family protein [Planktotalea arctica]|uniref:copper resistance CopC family protein n=1 Tax=Planktotalea arctica TaxID=1481893 RepID=UPI003218F373